MAEEVPTPPREPKEGGSIIWDFVPLTIYLVIAFAIMRILGVSYD